MLNRSLFVSLFFPALAVAAPVPKFTPADAVAKFFDDMERGRGNSSVFWNLPQADVIRELARHFDDEKPGRRSPAVTVAASIGQHATDQTVRSLATAILLDHATGADGGKKRSATYAIDSLVPFKKADFNAKAAETVAKLASGDSPNPNVLLLAGLLEAKAATDALKRWAEHVPGRSRFENPHWSARLALGRMGDADAAKFSADAIEGEKDLVQRVRQFGWLVYLRNDAAKKLLAGYLASDDRLPGVKPGVDGQRVAVFALTQLAGSVKDFPVKQDLTHHYTDEQLATARKWVKEQKELIWKE